MKHEQWDAVFTAHLVAQLAACRDRHSLGGHDGEVVAFGEIDALP